MSRLSKTAPNYFGQFQDLRLFKTFQDVSRLGRKNALFLKTSQTQGSL